jgi:hypothetical protein
MRVRDLKRKVGEATVHVWAQRFASSYGRGDKFAEGEGEVGTLRSSSGCGDRISSTIEYGGREHVGSLQWEAPPRWPTSMRSWRRTWANR